MIIHSFHLLRNKMPIVRHEQNQNSIHEALVVSTNEAHARVNSKWINLLHDTRSLNNSISLKEKYREKKSTHMIEDQVYK